MNIQFSITKHHPSRIGAWVFGDSLELASLVLGAFWGQGWSSRVKAGQAMPKNKTTPSSPMHYPRFNPKRVKAGQAIFMWSQALTIQHPESSNQHPTFRSSLVKPFWQRVKPCRPAFYQLLRFLIPRV